MRQVQRSQILAAGEHFSHVFHFRSVEVFQPFDLLERTIIVEPQGSGGGTEVSERGIEHHARGDTVFHSPCSCPCREGVISLFFRLLDAPGLAGAGGTLVIVVEGEGRLVRTLGNIGSHATGEIACFRVGHLNVSFVCIVGYCTLQLRAVGKHAFRLGTLPKRIAIDGSQRRATFEHQTHVGDLLGVEVLQVKRGQTRATGEHRTHVGDILGVKVRHVKRSQAGAILEHPKHVGDFLGVEVRHVKRGQTRATGEHRTHVGDILGVKVRHVKRSQAGAILEHPKHVGDFLGVEVRHVKRSYPLATGEHPSHVGDVLRVEVRQVQRSQTRATFEHPTHVGDVLRVEVRQVQRSQTRATVECVAHVFHFRSVEMFQPFYFREDYTI